MTACPHWLDILSWVYLAVSFASAAVILVDEIRRPQMMLIMDLVWPITALYFGPLAIWGYLRSGTKMTKAHTGQMRAKIRRELDRESHSSDSDAGELQRRFSPTPEQIAVGVCHCGAGCTLGDIAAEWWVFLAGLTFAGGAFQTRLLLDFLLAWAFGIAFQYFTLAPMRGLSLAKGVSEAIRADTLSIVAFEIGLFAWMAATHFIFFPGPHLEPTDAVFWFMMQVGMMIGFFTSYPANRFLLQRRWKEAMPQYETGMRRKMLRSLSGSRPA